MKHTLIKTEDYLLVVDKNEWDGNNVLAETKLLDKNLTIHNFQPNKGDRKILAHLPLNGAPYLDGVDVLPEIDYDLHINDAIGYAGSEGHPDPHAFSEKQIGLLHGYVEGFEQAKKIYKYTEEDLRKAAEWYFENKGNKSFEELTQLLNQPKLPVAFEVYMDTARIPNGDDGWETITTGIKATTNSEGRTEWFGKYLFD
jgi:hypothetical protein